MFGIGKGFDLFMDDIDIMFVGGVEFEDYLVYVGCVVDVLCEGEDCGGFVCFGRVVEEEVREMVGVDEFVDGGEDVLVVGDVVECYRLVFFDFFVKLVLCF